MCAVVMSEMCGTPRCFNAESAKSTLYTLFCRVDAGRRIKDNRLDDLYDVTASIIRERRTPSLRSTARFFT